MKERNPRFPRAYVAREAVIANDVIIGDDSRVEPYAVLGPGARLGRFCTVASGARVLGATLGDKVTVRECAVLNDEVVVFDDAEVHAGAVLGRVPKGAGATARAIGQLGSTRVGAGTQIGPHAVIYRGVTIGEECLIGDGASIREGCIVGNRVLISRYVTLNYDVTVGNSVKIMDMTHITGKTLIEDGVFISALVVTTNDNRLGREGFDETRIRGPIFRRGAAVGAGANILPFVEIGQQAVVGAAALVTRDVPPLAIVKGVPARVTGYIAPEVALG
jgi:acetyltransferase-like isoleucine patch superfamily enzyme